MTEEEGALAELVQNARRRQPEAGKASVVDAFMEIQRAVIKGEITGAQADILVERLIASGRTLT